MNQNSNIVNSFRPKNKLFYKTSDKTRDKTNIFSMKAFIITIKQINYYFISYQLITNLFFISRSGM